jgi:hypothetical protein
MNTNNRLSSRLLALIAVTAAVMTLPATVHAASIAAAEDLGAEITRDAESLRDYVSTHPVDVDRVNTALIFTNVSQRKLRVGCVAYNQHGTPIDRGWIAVAPNGMRFVLASEVAGGRDFVGNVKCKSGGRVIGSAVLLAPGLTDLPVEQHEHEGNTHLRFPVIAAY